MNENLRSDEAGEPSMRAGSPRKDVRASALVGAAGDDDDLCAGLAALSQLATGHMELADVLTRVAQLAVLAIPGADGAGLTSLEARHHDTIVASAPFAVEVDALQYGIEQGAVHHRCRRGSDRALRVVGHRRAVAALRPPGGSSRGAQCPVAAADNRGWGRRARARHTQT
ncbi:MAG: hypothetical protein M3N95_12420 [Actinomycetota bacterium]|nr:hypothetical protein [Actinomycetota bacterium]